MGARQGAPAFLRPHAPATLIDRYRVLGPVAVSVNAAGRFPFTGRGRARGPLPGQGPLNGLVSAFAGTDAQEIFLTATDLPFGDRRAGAPLAALRGAADACLLARGEKGL
jgi:molybdopterin-guanine dinucleotide biosynthesis protein A